MTEITVTRNVFTIRELPDKAGALEQVRPDTILGGIMATKTIPAWHYYLSQLAGTPCAECLTCGQIYVYWETEDLECHTEQHETENN